MERELMSPLSKETNEVATDCKWKRRAGFTLIELSIVFVIAGLMLAGFVRTLELYLVQKQEAEMVEISAHVRTSLSDFIEANKRFPCPSPLDVPVTDASFGEEQTTGSGPTLVCDATATGVFLDDKGDGTPVNDVYIGGVPVRTLGLGNQYSMDPRDNRLTYAISVKLAVEDGMLNPTEPGSITIHQAAGAPITDAQFTLIAHGLDGAGSYTASGALHGTACNVLHADGENCDMDGEFRDVEISRGETASYFDDRTAFSLLDDKIDGWWEATDPTGTNIVNRNPGNVGIGTDDPQAALHVKDNSTTPAPGILVEQNSSATTSPRIGLVDTKLGPADTAPAWGIDNWEDRFRIFNQPDINTAGSEFFTILNNGNVGIGTGTPQSKLDIQGEVKIGNTGAGCTASNRGATRYNSGADQMEYCADNAGTPQWMPMGGGSGTGMFPGWPDVLHCSSSDGVTYHQYFYLSGRTTSEIRYTDPYTHTSQGGGSYSIQFWPDGRYKGTFGGSTESMAYCIGKTISQLEADGRAFYFIR
ncbi:type II secretion system protein [Nitrospina watsonii]|uniref:Prepilin-type N-terminal cleavage/methylation domain-containing protein n=1 Tax=Nitrospina watsonii TaxID=1323948 RepID=A0ABN8W2Q4_9BACT|nr:prepilin-type N-terminal cleavage/methylation domain-containing protein [Nitrospina watsonii]CAI2717541.1 protein of unknown function [Nitrospina watsonii]